jgi:hypothetical protein
MSPWGLPSDGNSDEPHSGFGPVLHQSMITSGSNQPIHAEFHAADRIGASSSLNGNAANGPIDRSGLDLRAWAEALNALPSREIAESDVRTWLEGPLQRFFPFKRCLCAYGNLSAGSIRLRCCRVGMDQSFYLVSRVRST